MKYEEMVLSVVSGPVELILRRYAHRGWRVQRRYTTELVYHIVLARRTR